MTQGIERCTGNELSAKRKCLKAIEAKLWGRVWSGVSVNAVTDVQPSELEMEVSSESALDEMIDREDQLASDGATTAGSGGGATDEVRASLRDQQLNAEQLALALTDMATDRCLWAHTYTNWEPWF